MRRLRSLLFPALVVVAGLVAAASSVDTKSEPAHRYAPGLVLTAGSPSTGANLTVSTSIVAAPSGSAPWTSCSGAVVALYPGATDCLLYTVTNNLNVPVYLTQLSLVANNTTFTTTQPTNPAKPSCKSGDLITPAFMSAPPANLIAANGGAITLGESVSLKDDGNQDNCENGTFNFTVSATAKYEDSTITSWGSTTTGKATVGHSVNLTASVTPSNSTLDTSLPYQESPSGTNNVVDFYSCTSSSVSSCNGLLGSETLNTSDQATYPTGPLAAGTYYYLAKYPGSGSGDDFAASNAATVWTETVDYTSTISGNQNGGLTVSSGQTVDVISGSKVNGSVTVQSGGGLVVTGGTVNGGITTNGSIWLSLCGTSMNGGLSVAGSTGPVTIGNTSASCPINSIKGGVTLANNRDGVTLSGNSISGGLACTGNTGLTNKPTANTVSGTRSGQCIGNF